jgi:hypothetical protein
MDLIMRAAFLSGIGALSEQHTLQFLSMRNSYIKYFLIINLV